MRKTRPVHLWLIHWTTLDGAEAGVIRITSQRPRVTHRQARLKLRQWAQAERPTLDPDHIRVVCHRPELTATLDETRGLRTWNPNG